MEQLTPPAAADMPASSGSTGQATVAAQIETATVPVADALDDLTQIKGVTEADAEVLRDAGFTTFSAIAGWSAADVARANAGITGERRVSRENWIEQAQLLKNGGSTAYTSSVLARLAPRPEGVVTASSGASPEVVPATPLTASDSSSEEATDQAVAAASPEDSSTVSSTEAPAPVAGPEAATAGGRTAAPDVSERAAFARERRGYADDLQQIDGINGEVEKLLNEQGVTRIAQIASWPPQEAQRIDRLLGSMDRIRRENWVGQARRISGFSETESQPSADQEVQLDDPSPEQPIADEPPVQEVAPSAAAAPAGNTPEPTEEPSETEAPESNVLPLSSVPNVARNNVSNFRSVRSEALVGTPSIDPDNPGDDLKRIRGIGVLIEKRLRAMGYTSYEQIGSWTQSDVDRVNQKLDFRGRIERENWIEQARILAAGGQTEFSRRQERDDN